MGRVSDDKEVYAASEAEGAVYAAIVVIQAVDNEEISSIVYKLLSIRIVSNNTLPASRHTVSEYTRRRPYLVIPENNNQRDQLLST